MGKLFGRIIAQRSRIGGYNFGYAYSVYTLIIAQRSRIGGYNGILRM